MPPRRTRNSRSVSLALVLVAVLSVAPVPRLAARDTPKSLIQSARGGEATRRRAEAASPLVRATRVGDAPGQAPKGGGAAAAQRPRGVALEQAILVVEDSRAEDDAALAPLREGLKAEPRLQTLAVRALGRLERASLIPEIAALLDSSVVEVRAEAANALGQAVIRGEPGPAIAPLTARARTESHVVALAALARTLGRLPYQQESEVRDAERTIQSIADRAAAAASPAAADALPDPAASAEPAKAARRPAATVTPDATETIMLTGVAHGLDALARRAVKLGSLSADTRSRLRKLARHGLTAEGLDAARAPSADANVAGGAVGGAAAGAGSGRPRTGSPASRPTGASGADAAEEAARAASEATARVRRLAVSALVTARESNVPLLREVLRDPDDQVRRLGVVWLGATEEMPLRDEAFRQAYGDASAMVRYEVLRIYGRVRQTASVASAGASAGRMASTAAITERAGTWGTTIPAIPAPSPLDADSSASAQATTPSPEAGECALEVKALDDANANVALLAIDLLGRCGDRQAALDRLTPLVSAFFEAPRSGAAAGVAQAWHRPAHALVALARLAPDRAAPWLARAVAHDVWRVRLYAARAAGVMKDRATLDTLAADGEDNVREAAIEALQALVGHEADAQYLAALDRSDPQLLRTAARALVGTAQKTDAAERALKTFVRISAARRETSRDVRLALLDTLDSLSRASDTKPQGSPDQPAARAAGAQSAPVENAIETLRPYLKDFDPVVAQRVSGMLTAWTGQGQAAAPTRLPATAVPSPREIERMGRTRAIVRMARGGTFTLALRPDVAPTNVARFVRLARAGTFNGLTFHRVEPNFVLQGGSPGANEYSGDGPFTRDELALTSNLRGTVGVSTRGRDTGDGQIYVNLVDNARLDHNYTVFADIVDGLPLMDEILEGDVIARIELREPPPR